MGLNKGILQRLAESADAGEKHSLAESLFEEAAGDVKGLFAEVGRMLEGGEISGSAAASERRRTWKNHTENQVVQPLQTLEPKSYAELQDLVRNAEANGAKVRAVGSGHSFSDVVQTTDFLVRTDALNAWLDVDRALLKKGIDASRLVQVENGIKIHELNDTLDQRGLALPNMGGYDAQSIVGAASTSTHGSGITLGPIAEFYRSIVLISDGGQTYRIERTNGITDPAAYRAKYTGNKLIQDDAWFNTVAVSMGCTGLIYSVIMEVMPKYWLEEKRELSDWGSVKKLLLDGAELQNNRHFEVLVNPYEVKGARRCLVTRRNIVPEPANPGEAKGSRNFLTELVGMIPGATNIFELVFDTFPELSPMIIDEAMKGLVDDSYIDVSYKVLNLGSANNISAYSAEIGFPMKENRYIAGVERMFEVADRMRRLGSVYHTSPISLRFVKGSEIFLSMMNGGDTCMVEIPVVNGTYGGFELLERYESEMFAFGGRPHWGQVNALTGSRDLIRRMYPKFDDWLAVERQLNAKGTFDGPFTDRCGISFIDFKG